VVVTDGALNLIDRQYLEKQAQELSRTLQVSVPAGPASQEQELAIGVLLGGDTKHFLLPPQVVNTVLEQLNKASDKINAHILATTSRRTSLQAQEIVKTQLRDWTRTKLLVIANEKNHPFAVGGIIGLSTIVVLSPESISMISEALNGTKYVVVFEAAGLSLRHRRFLENLRAGKFIFLVRPERLCDTIEQIIATRPAHASFDDRALVAQAVRKIL
jgi:mitochondrial fission protein ELM1